MVGAGRGDGFDAVGDGGGARVAAGDADDDGGGFGDDAGVAEGPALSVRDLAVSGTDVIAELVAVERLPSGSRGGFR